LGLQSFGIDKEELRQRLAHIFDTQGYVKQAEIKPEIAFWFTKKYLRQNNWEPNEVFKDDEGGSDGFENITEDVKKTDPDNPEKFENALQLYPDEFEEPGGVPTFHPTMEQWSKIGSITELVKLLENWGVERGLVKISPPQEWHQSLGSIVDYARAPIDRHVLRRSAKQIFVGNSGVFRATSETMPDVSVLEFAQIGMNSNNWTPHIDRENAPSTPQGGKSRARKKEEELGKSDGLPEALGQTNWDELLALAPKFTDEALFDLERSYWRNLTYGTPFHAMGQNASLFPDSFAGPFNLKKMENMLVKKGVNVPGISSPQLSFGTWKSTSPWQLEPADLLSGMNF
jgi:hypothetical protein